MKKNQYKLPIAVFLIVENNEKKILFIKRASTGWKDGYYSLPAGGLEENEDIYSACIREAKEEVGIYVKEQDLQHYFTQHCLLDGQNWINIYFFTTIWENIPRICEPEKHSEITWCTIKDLPSPLVEYVQTALLSTLKNEGSGVFIR